jgi:hypothetical protein
MRTLRLSAIVFLLAGPSRVFAQEELPPPPAQPQLPPEQPPPEAPQPPAPPPYPPQYAAPPPPTYYYSPPYAHMSREQIALMEHHAKSKLIGGTVLLATGGALVLTGIGLIIGGVAANHGWCTTDNGFRTNCANDGLVFGGGTTIALGVAAIIPGAFLRAQGAHELRTARALGRTCCAGWTLRPRVGPNGALAELRMGF